MVKLAQAYITSGEAKIKLQTVEHLSSHSELLNFIASIITKITHFSPLKCLERCHDEIPHPDAEEQPTTFIFGNKELFCPIHRLVEQLHNMVYLCRLHFFHDSFSYLHLVSFSFNLKHIWCRFTGTFTLYFGFKSCRPHLQVHEQIAIWNYSIFYTLNFSFMLESKIRKKYLWEFFFLTIEKRLMDWLTHWFVKFLNWMASLNIINKLLSTSNQISLKTCYISLERFILVPSYPPLFFGPWSGSPCIFLKSNTDYFCFACSVSYNFKVKV